VSRLNVLRYGEPRDAADLIGGQMSPDTQEMLLELRAALVNALNHIHMLDVAVLELKAKQRRD
jgi:hypothetical protein